TTALRSRFSPTRLPVRGSSAFLRGRRWLCTSRSPSGASRACGAGGGSERASAPTSRFGAVGDLHATDGATGDPEDERGQEQQPENRPWARGGGGGRRQQPDERRH